jgi:hypothetical protein
MASDLFVEWLERKLKEHGIKKLVPGHQALTAAYRRAVFLQRVQEEVAKLRKVIAEESIEVPNGLARTVRAELRDRPELAWDDVVWQLAARLRGRQAPN